MKKITETILGIVCFIVMIILLFIFIDNVYIFGALYLLLFAITLIIYTVMMIIKNKYAELFGKAIMVFLVIGISSIFFRTEMISYGTRYIRYLTEVVFDNNSSYLGYDGISIHNEKSDDIKEKEIEDGRCSELTDAGDIEFVTCKFDFSSNDYVLLWSYTWNYMDKIEYKLNDGEWYKTGAYEKDIESSEYMGLFKKEYIYSRYRIELDYKKIKNGKNTFRIKFGKKESTLTFEVNKISKSR